MGSEAHCLFGRERTAEATSLCVTGRKSKKTQSVDVKLVVAVLEAATRMCRIDVLMLVVRLSSDWYVAFCCYKLHLNVVAVRYSVIAAGVVDGWLM